MIIDNEPDPKQAERSKNAHAVALADTIVQRINAEQDCFNVISDGSNTYVVLNPTATRIIESYLRENL